MITCPLVRMNSSDSNSLQNLTSEYFGLINLKQDTQILRESIDNSDNLNFERIWKFIFLLHKSQMKSEFQKPPSVCWSYVNWNFMLLCQFRCHLCECWGRMGHKEGFCEDLRNQWNRLWTRLLRFQWKSNFVLTTFNISAGYALIFRLMGHLCLCKLIRPRIAS